MIGNITGHRRFVLIEIGLGSQKVFCNCLIYPVDIGRPLQVVSNDRLILNSFKELI